jgi:hypothetical protein
VISKVQVCPHRLRKVTRAPADYLPAMRKVAWRQDHDSREQKVRLGIHLVAGLRSQSDSKRGHNAKTPGRKVARLSLCVALIGEISRLVFSAKSSNLPP